MKPEQVITAFLQSEFTDERLAILRIDAIAGCVPYRDATACLVAHAREFWLDAFQLPNARAAERAYLSLGSSRWWDLFVRYDLDSSKKMRRLIPLIDAEIERRRAARKEVAEKAKEVLMQPSQSLLSIQKGQQSFPSTTQESVSLERVQVLPSCHEDHELVPNR